ncbi:MAG TPA: CAP domain-containing protein [Fimbriimonas sp.]|nr:CAP domain-containing protein [Fimbriimonas sp.]
MLITAIAAATALPKLVQQPTVRLLTEGFGPSGSILVARPKVAWKVWPGGSAKITAGRISINSKSVSCKYDSDRRELLAEGVSTLSPGTYNVHASVTIDGWANFEEKWQFVIGTDSVDLPTYTRDEKSAINELNGIRAKHQLPPMTIDPYLTMSSRSHTDYLALHDVIAHEESPDKLGFTGVMPWDRGKRHGHVGGIWEVVSGGTETAEAAIYNLWNAPYHRITLMQTGRSLVGVGWKKGHFTMNGTPSWDRGVYMAPYAGQENVPVLWANQEVPNPTRNYPDARFLLGYPIVVAGSELPGGKMDFVSASLVDSNGNAVDTYLLHRQNDDNLTNAVIVIPKAPLKFNEMYTADVRVIVQGDVITQRKWTFTTQADNKSK